VRGRFITFEGIEGCGKSSQAARLVERLQAAGHRVHAAREPGGTPAAEAIRGVMLDPAHEGLSAETELLLVTAARADHCRRVLEPALAAGTNVVCDRFSDSTRAYQGGGRQLDPDTIERVDAFATGGLVPDATLLLDLPAELGLERARSRNHEAGSDGAAESRIDDEDLAFHRRVRSGFLRLAGQEPTRLWVIDASGDVDDVSARIDRALERALPGFLAARPA
jgi:dTMP kinase